MRSRTMLFAMLLAVCIVAVAFVTAAADSCCEKHAKKAEKAEKTEECVKAEKAEKAETKTEEAKPVTATLNYFKSGKGEKLSKDVEYLPMGTKIATMETSKGIVKIELWEDKAPNTVINFVSLANAGRYDGVIFHRVIDGFMAQTGDVEHKKGTGGPGYSIPAEFDDSLKHMRGVVSMARASEPNSGGSQFFIMFASSSHLDGQYAAFGKVIEGMDIVDSLQKGDGQNGSFVNAKEDKIIKMRVESAPESK